MSDDVSPTEPTPRAPKSQMLRTVEAIAHAKAAGQTVSLEIDGKPVAVPLGTTILEAARQLNIRIPTLCYHEDLCLAGVCRICLVEIEGQRSLQAACSYPLTTACRIHTRSSKVRRARRHVLDLLLSTHYGECYSCGRNNNCELQSLAMEYGVDFFRFGHPDKPRHDVDKSSYSLVRDNNKCVLCRRCIRTCIDLQEVGVLEVLGRGDRTRVSTFMGKPLVDVICINCGQCINRCPTGGPTTRPTRFGPRSTTRPSTS
jgi:NADH dehydrogenase/NADH:ubiquinone oxidoreductase subunit G